MARLLFRIGQSAARRARWVVFAWIAIAALAVGAFATLGGTLATTFSVPGTETSRVADRIADELGQTAGATGTVVFSSDAPLTDAQQGEIAALNERVADLDGVDTVVDPFATEAQRTAQAQELREGRSALEEGRVQADAGAEQLADARAQLEAALEQAQQAGPQAAAPLQEQLAQLEAQEEELEAGRAEIEAQESQLEAGETLLEASSGIRTVSEDGTAALATVVFEQDIFSLPEEVRTDVVALLEDASVQGVTIDWSNELAATTEGLVGPAEIIGVAVAAIALLIMFRAVLPAVVPLVSSLVGVATSVTGALAFSGVVEMSSVTPILGLMLGLAVGIDYSLFILNRHRRHRREGMDALTSIGLANGTAGNAVVFAGSTVIIALLALNVTGISFLGVMGTVGAVSVLVAVLAAVTLTPALAMLVGDRILGRGASRRTTGASTPARAMKGSTALVGAVVGVAALLVIAIPALDMRLGLPDGSSEPQDSTAYRAYSLTAEEFGIGLTSPLVVAAELTGPVDESAVPAAQARIAEDLLANPRVSAVAPAGVSPDRDFLVLQVVPTDGPSAEATEQLVDDLRATASDDLVEEVGVAGATSGNIDISEILSDALPVYLAVVIGLSLVILVVVFRSIAVPLIATAGFVLSLLAAFGAMVAIYQWGWLSSVFGVNEPGPLLSFAPILIMGILFGLAMDYQLFLVSGMREAWVHGTPAREAVVEGRRNGIVVVTVAAIIMISVFGGFVFSHLTVARPLGFGLAAGVLFDAFVVRMVIVPSLMHVLGERAWWLPGWLDRLLPDVDVEGAALERDVPAPATA
ncbi:MMPL family transporter [Aeromicrobium halocynthiae]|uniref:MMPL family transporter n=1 Tax=Aeromicrobium halocynthiae TaxID=560557 RepID=A0ABN2W3K6_9ACTN